MISNCIVDWKDVQDVDLYYIRSLKTVFELNALGKASSEDFEASLPVDSFYGITFTGREVSLVPRGRAVVVTPQNFNRYAALAIRQRLQEMAEAVVHLRRGLVAVAPLAVIDLMPVQALETLVCGTPLISVQALKRLTRYRDVDPDHPNIIWLWEILEHQFSEEDRVLFMVFVSGRSRLPANPAADLSQRFQVMKVDKPKDGLPTAQTCFFQLRLPPYSSKAVMAERLLYAIRHCRNIDADNYMLVVVPEMVRPPRNPLNLPNIEGRN